MQTQTSKTVTLMLAAATTYAAAQSFTLSGLVMDGSAGVPLAGATVTLAEAGVKATTDSLGRYTLKGPAKPVTDTVTFGKDTYGSVSRSVKSADGIQNVVLTLEGKVTYVCSTADAKGNWQLARTVFDPKTKTSKITYLTQTTQWNFKPNFCPDGSKLTFFRRYVVKGPDLKTWRSAICVMDADGGGFHEITTREERFNTEPYWTRDGSMRVSFNRMFAKDQGGYWNDFDGQPGKERRIAHGGWVNPHLADGRIFLQRGGKSYLGKLTGPSTPDATLIKRPDEKFIHKISISRDEKMIAYQKWVDKSHDMYRGGVMVYADFDASIPAITHEVIFDALDPSTQAWYVSISTDNKYLLFAKDGAILQHDVKAGTTMKVSADSDPYKAYPTYTTFSK